MWSKKSVYTPWGMSDNEEIIADGIIFYSTPSHGGIRLAPAQQEIVRKKFPNFAPFVGMGKPWYEEDADVAVVMAAFPQAFKPEEVERAKKMILGNPTYYMITEVQLAT